MIGARSACLATVIGMGVVAAELASRYGLRPRAAWRRAHGWSQTHAAERISAVAYAAGLLAHGDRVAMTRASVGV